MHERRRGGVNAPRDPGPHGELRDLGETVAAWRTSGQTADAFAAGRGFAGSTLRWWASHAGRRKAAIVQVVRAAPARDAVLELAVGDVRVLVRTGLDRALLGEVLEVPRRRPRP